MDISSLYGHPARSNHKAAILKTSFLKIPKIGHKWPPYAHQGTRNSEKLPFMWVLGPDPALVRVSSKSESGIVPYP